MSLEVQQSKKGISNNQPSKMQLNRTYMHSILNNQPKILHVIPEQLELQLKQISSTIKADYVYLTNLRKKTFNAIKQYDYEWQIQVKENIFIKLKNNLLQQKLIKEKKRRFVRNLLNVLVGKNKEKQQEKKAVKYRNLAIKRVIFNEIKGLINIKKIEQKVRSFLISAYRKQFLLLFKQSYIKSKKKQIQQQQEKYQIISWYQLKLIKKYFISFIINTNQAKLIKILRLKQFKKFKNRLNDEKIQTEKKLTIFKQNSQKRIKQSIFNKLKQIKLQSECLEWYQYKLSKKYFSIWLNYIQTQKNQKQISQANQILLKHYLQQKQPSKNLVLLKKSFQLWTSFTTQSKTKKKQAQLLQQFGQIKQKQFLQRKYFNLLLLNKNHSKSQKHYAKKLKLKIFEKFKQNLIKQTNKLENVFRFVQNRNLRKYFVKIQQFNKKYKEIVKSYRTKKYFNLFTFSIIKSYYQKQQKSIQYHNILLLFKSFVGLKENVEFNKKAAYCAYYINIARPLKKWINNNKIRKYYYNKQQQKLKRIFFQWKIITIRRQLSNKKQKVNYLNDENEINFNQDISLINYKKANPFSNKSAFLMIDSKIQHFQNKNTQLSQQEQSDQEEEQQLQSNGTERQQTSFFKYNRQQQQFNRNLIRQSEMKSKQKLLFSNRNNTKQPIAHYINKQPKYQLQQKQKLQQKNDQQADQIDKKVSALLNKINSQRKSSKTNTLQQQSNENNINSLNHFKTGVKNESSFFIQKESSELKSMRSHQFRDIGSQKQQKIRIPTWSSVDKNQFKVSVFQEEDN